MLGTRRTDGPTEKAVGPPSTRTTCVGVGLSIRCSARIESDAAHSLSVGTLCQCVPHIHTDLAKLGQTSGRLFR